MTMASFSTSFAWWFPSWSPHCFPDLLISPVSIVIVLPSSTMCLQSCVYRTFRSTPMRSTICTQNGTLVNGNMGYNLRPPGGLILTHTQMTMASFATSSCLVVFLMVTTLFTPRLSVSREGKFSRHAPPGRAPRRSWRPSSLPAPGAQRAPGH